MFIGRKKELEALNAFYEGDKEALACVSGALGMGKTTLLRHFADGKKAIYFHAYETTGKQELSMFTQVLAKADIAGVAAGEDTGKRSEASLENLLDAITEIAKQEKLLLVIDQYPNFVKADADFDEILFSYVTRVWRDLPIKLILCGDAFLLMEKYLYGKKARWKDTIDLHLNLTGMDFLETKQFFPEAAGEDLALYYGISGGIPAQIVRMQGKSVKDAAKTIFVGRPGQAALLPEQVMGMELRELSYYNCILSAMAQGMNRVNQLSAEVGKPKGVVVPYLNALMSIGVVTKQTAITEETNRKKTRYSIVNSNTVFWYRFIVPHMDLYVAGEWDLLWNTYIVPDLDNFMQQVFIAMSREHLEERSRRGQMPFTIERSGNWWTNDDEAGTTDGFDVVSLGKTEGKSATIFTLCFYEQREIEVAEVKSMIEKTKQMHREGDAFYVVCAKDRFHENVETVASTIKNIILVTLDEECRLA